MSYSSDFDIKKSFGESGFALMGFIESSCSKFGYKTKFNLESRTVTILNSSDLSPTLLRKAFYPNGYFLYEEGWFPVVEKSDALENLQISFTCNRVYYDKESDSMNLAKVAMEYL